ncbi:MAG: LPP20 family lipoprotein [Elusimicrobiales bacterium]
MKRAIISLSAVAAMCCAARAMDKPDWVDGQSLEYPRARYVTGVGSADDRASAEDRARAEIARVFSTSVTATSTISESESKSSSAGASFSQQVGETVQTASKKMLEGAEIAEVWQDNQTKRYYALATLEKAKAAAIASAKLADLDAQIKTWRDSYEQAKDRPVKIKSALKLSALFGARADIVSELRVLDAAPAAQDDAQFAAKVSQTISGITIAVSAKGENGKQVETGIIGALTGMGFAVRKPGGDSKDADIIAEADVSSETLAAADSDGWKWARGTATVALKDAATGKVFAQFEASERQASSAQEEAARRSLAAASRSAAEKTASAVKSYFENQ